MKVLEPGEVHVTSPDGIALRFTIGPDRPFSKQDGDASAERMKTAKVRVDREISCPRACCAWPRSRRPSTGGSPFRRPASATRPPPASVSSHQGRGHRRHGRHQRGCGEDVSRLRTWRLALSRARARLEPELQVPAGEIALPYYGYGDAVARLGLGDNEEVGGNVRGGGVRWLFFPNTTITVGDTVLVKDGKLVEQSS